MMVVVIFQVLEHYVQHLAATIGTGNIVGVATAIKAGGPGALFWMWLAAVFRNGD